MNACLPLVHSDVKMQNILLTAKGVLKIGQHQDQNSFLAS